VKAIEGRLARIGDKLAGYADAWTLRLYRKRTPLPWGVGWFPTGIHNRINGTEADLVHLHWLGGGFVPVRSLSRLVRPCVWTLHDTWPFTGGCHYFYTCDRYQKACGTCPQLASRSDHDLSRWVWKTKHKHWQALNITLIAPSRWMAECARASSLFRDARIEVICYGLDLTHYYRPIDQAAAREILGLPKDKKLIAFGAIKSTTDPRKGFQYLKTALKQLAANNWGPKAESIIFGASEPLNPPDLGLQARYLGHLHDDMSLALVYSAADVMIVPSIQESFGQTASEAMACGTPVVAFGATGLLDIVDHGRTGYLARPYEPDDLAEGIAWVLEDEERLARLRREARVKAEHEFALSKIVQKHLNLYQELITR
jgi:glycosyltransferase involved in cell wall biosynthesis